MIRFLACMMLTGCVAEYDPDVFVVLPDVADPCGTIGAAEARISVDTTDGEHFEIASRECGPIGDRPLAGFALALDRLTYGYHRAAIAILDDTGLELGRIERPFAAEGPLVVPLAYADLPGWPTAPLAFACEAPAIELTITPALATRPSFHGTVACTSTLDVPRGPVTVEARTVDPCALAIAETFVVDPDSAAPGPPLALELVPVECP